MTSTSTSSSAVAVVHDARNCVVCMHLNSSYKCPLCYSRYCSLDCYQSHRRACNQHIPKKPVAQNESIISFDKTTTIKDNKIQEITGNENICSDQTNSNTESESNVLNRLIANDDEVQLLDDIHKEKLMASKQLRSLLRSKRLRADIINIDSSTDRQGTLKAIRTKNKEFESFIDVLLNTVKSSDN